MSEIDSAESDLAPAAVEVDVESSAEGTEQPVVESDEQGGLFDKLFIEKKQKKDGEQSFNEDSLTFNVDGEQLTMAELKDGYLRQADYTRKTQELSQIRKENENAIVLWKSLQERPQETLQALWKRVASGQAPVETSQEDVDIEAIVAQRVEEAIANDPRVKAAEEQEVMARVMSTFAEIESENDVKLNEADQIRVLERAQELETPDLKYAFFTLRQEAASLERQRRNAEANSSASGVQTAVGEPDTGPKHFKSVREALDDTLRESGLSRDTVFVV
jgi:hypothetical protein